MIRIFLVLFLLSIQLTYSQNENEYSEAKIYLQIFGKCFKNLEQIPEIKKLASLSKTSFCSLYQCVNKIIYSENEKDIQEAILKRAAEITILLYKEGTPVYLTSGMGTLGEADEKNQNLTDDNNLVYISVAECITSNSLEKIKDIVNQQTLRLINTK